MIGFGVDGDDVHGALLGQLVRVNGFSVDGVVFLAGSNELDINHLHPAGNAHHQAVVIALDVEHHAAVFKTLALRYWALMSAGWAQAAFAASSCQAFKGCSASENLAQKARGVETTMTRMARV